MRHYEGAHVHPMDHHGATWGTEQALGPRSADYCWIRWASKEGLNWLQYTKQINCLEHTWHQCVCTAAEDRAAFRSPRHFSSVELLNHRWLIPAP